MNIVVCENVCTFGWCIDFARNRMPTILFSSCAELACVWSVFPMSLRFFRHVKDPRYCCSDERIIDGDDELGNKISKFG